MRASIVQIVRLMSPKYEKTTLFPLLWHAFRNSFFDFLPKNIYLRHLNKRIMRASIVQIVRPMFLKHTKKQLFKNNQIGESPQKTAETSIVKESENSA